MSTGSGTAAAIGPERLPPGATTSMTIIDREDRLGI